VTLSGRVLLRESVRGPPRSTRKGIGLALFLACVGKVVFDVPGFAAVGGRPAKLTDLVGTLRDKLQVPFQRGSAGLGNFVRKIIHDAVP
jgi:hypothetical protein